MNEQKSEQKTEVAVDGDTIVDLVRRERRPEILTIKHGDVEAPILATPNGAGGYEYRSLKGDIDAFKPAPAAPSRREGTATFKDLDSFLAHVARFKDGDSVIWADPSRESPRLTSVLDYHRAGHDGAPRFGKHRGMYAFERSPEWLAWSKVWNGTVDTSMSQADFAKFIEARLVDVADPSLPDGAAAKLAAAAQIKFASASDLYTLSRGLTVNVKRTAGESVDPATGESSLVFTSEHTGAGGEKVSAPRAFLIEIPVFRGGDKYLIAIWLRRRMPERGDEGIRWWLEGYRVNETFDHAFAESCSKAAKDSGLPVYVGSPE